MAPERPLTQAIRPDRAYLSLREYEAGGGYQALRKAMREMSPADVLIAVKDSNLRGRGGAGFPTGQKWSFVPVGKDAPHPKYMIANADEMEPGTFKDRLLLEGNPHLIVEGLALSAYAIEADVAYVFLRWEYRLAAEHVARAIAEAYDAGYLGKRMFGSGYDLEMHLHVSAGRYLCGEETGLINALEGKRANPRAKPPFPQASGLWGRPTVVDNVETLCNVPVIVDRGAAWYKTLSPSKDTGTKLYGASGRVNRPGVWELPIGTTLRELLEDHAGGMREGFHFRGVQPGGASTDFLVEQHLDTPMDFDSVTKAGSRLGTGFLIVLDDRTCPVGMVHNLEQFFSQESCGWCTPCWGGLQWCVRLLADIDAGHGTMEDLNILKQQCVLLGPGRTYCAHAPGAVEPLQSALKYFRDDFVRHIRERRCPWSGSA